MSHSWSWRIVTKKVSWSLYAGTSTDRNILLDITRLGCHQSSRKARQRDAERLVAQQDLTPQRQRIEETQHRRGKSSEPSTTLTRRWSWRQVSTKCPDDEAFRKSTGADGVLSGSLLVRERKEETKRRREGREGKERWDGGTGLDSHPSWNRRDGEASLSTKSKYKKLPFLSQVNHYPHNHPHQIKNSYPSGKQREYYFELKRIDNAN